MKILLQMTLILSIFKIKEILSETSTNSPITNTTKLTEIKKIKRGIIGITNLHSQPPSGHFHYYPFSHSQHGQPIPQNNPSANVAPQGYVSNRPTYELNSNIKPVQDNTPESQSSYQNPQQIPQDSNNGFVGGIEQATISPYFPIAPVSDSTPLQQQYSPTNYYSQPTIHLEPNAHQQAQFPVHIEPFVGSAQQRTVPVPQYHSTVQHYPGYWNGNPAQQQYPQQHPIKYPSLLNNNKPQFYQQSYPVNNPGSVAPQTFLTNKNYHPQNNIKYYNQASIQPTVTSPIKYTLSSAVPLSYTTPGPLSPYVKNHQLLLQTYKKSQQQPIIKEQKKSNPEHRKEEEYDEDKTEEKGDQNEDIEEDEEPNRSTNRKPKYNSYRNSYNDDDDDYFSRHRYSDDDEDDYSSSSPLREDHDDDEESEAATPYKIKTKYVNSKKIITGKTGNNKYTNNGKNNKNNRYKSKQNVQKSESYRPKTKVDAIEGKYSHQVPVTTDQKSKAHYQAKWYTYSSINKNDE